MRYQIYIDVEGDYWYLNGIGFCVADSLKELKKIISRSEVPVPRNQCEEDMQYYECRLLAESDTKENLIALLQMELLLQG